MRVVSDNEPRTILMADDDEDDRMLAQDALRRAGCRNVLHCVADGEELMDYLLRRGAYAWPHPAPRPGLLLLDLNMPRKDGREALQEIKSHVGLRSIAVVVFTTSEAQEDIDSAYAMGANSFISKPVTFEGLVRALRIMEEYWFDLVRQPRAAL